jgi:multidrug efflux pump subunit AcrA (membrane-fusion protein)
VLRQVGQVSDLEAQLQQANDTARVAAETARQDLERLLDELRRTRDAAQRQTDEISRLSAEVRPTGLGGSGSLCAEVPGCITA